MLIYDLGVVVGLLGISEFEICFAGLKTFFICIVVM